MLRPKGIGAGIALCGIFSSVILVVNIFAAFNAYSSEAFGSPVASNLVVYPGFEGSGHSPRWKGI